MFSEYYYLISIIFATGWIRSEPNISSWKTRKIISEKIVGESPKASLNQGSGFLITISLLIRIHHKSNNIIAGFYASKHAQQMTGILLVQGSMYFALEQHLSGIEICYIGGDKKTTRDSG